MIKLKITKISENIWSLRSWIIFPITVWLVVEEDGVTLVDTGMSFMATGILNFIEQLNVGTLKGVLLTHGHPDHIGALHTILKKYPVPVYAHAQEIPYLLGELSYKEGNKAVSVLNNKQIHAFTETEQGQLQSINGLTPHHTPGHSPGHTAFYHEKDKVLLAGDLFSSKKGKFKKPYFTSNENMKEVLKSSMIVNQLPLHQVEVCHGRSVFNPQDELEVYITANVKKYS